MRSARTNGGLVVLCHLLALPTHGYVASRPSSLVPRSAFVNSASSRQPSASAIPRPITRHAQQHRQQHVLFSSKTTELYNNATDSVDSPVSGDVPSSSSSSGPAVLGTSGDWSAYLDESKGLIYYFNPRTGVSKWEPPEGVDFSGVQMKIGAAKKVEMRERLKTYLEERLNDSASNFEGAIRQQDRRDAEWKRKEAGEKLKTMKAKLESTQKVVPDESKTNNGRGDIVAQWGEWQALVDNKRGQIYYYNKKTRESIWERPDGFPAFKLSASKRTAMEEQSKRYLEWHNKDAAKVNVLGKGAVTVSDSNFNDVADEPEAKTNVPTTNAAADEESSNVEMKSNVKNQPPTLPIVQQGEWSAYFDIRSGLVYYFNEETAETSWDPPYNDFPRIVMENTVPKVLDPGSGNISMERALGYIGVDEMAEALAWEEAKKKERAMKAAKRAKEAEAKEGAASASAAERESVEMMYEAVKKAELERLEQEKKLAEELKAKVATKLAEEERLNQEVIAEKEAAAAKEREAAARLAGEEKLKQEIIAAQEAATKEREAVAKLAEEEKLEQERIAAEEAAAKESEVAAKLAEQETLKQGRIAAEEAASKEREAVARLAEEEKLKQERIAADEAAAKDREVAARLAEEEKTKQERIATEESAAKERETAAKLAIQEKLEQERLEKESLERERLEKDIFEAEEKRKVEAKVQQQPMLPKEDPTFTAENIETMVAPLKTRTLYDILQCSTSATRTELKRSYLSLAKESHPDALLQYGMVNDAKTELMFVEISHAWKILGDPMSRRRYDRELKAKGLSSKAGNMFESWVMGAAKAMDGALAKAEGDLKTGDGKKP